MKTRGKIESLTKQDDTTATEAKDKAESLNAFFSSVFTDEELYNIPISHFPFEGMLLSTITITQQMVRNKLMQLKSGKSPGPDGWHPHFLKELADFIDKPLSILFQKSLDEAILSVRWLEATITAVHKKGPKDILGNYRPISLTSVICKTLESLVRDELVKHMLQHELFAKNQHGFIPKRDCMTNLLSCIETSTRIIEEGESIDLIYTDFSKAFDSVPHQRLLQKIANIGIDGKVHKWVKSFLSGRKHRVSVEGELSCWANVKSGIPQGSVLGPILFVIFINDMPNTIRSFCQLFADDAKIFRNIKSPSDSDCLQEDIDKLTEWSIRWQLPFNESKCKSMHIGYKNEWRKYKMNDHLLEQVTEEKDLGVIIDNELKFHKHTAATIKKANSILGLIKKSFVSLDKYSLPLLYKSLIRPHLEYGNVIWGPHYKEDQKAVEKVQRRATKLITIIKYLPYEQRLQHLNLPSLMHRRRRGDMIQVYKMITGKVDIDMCMFFKFSSLPTRGHRYKLLKQHASKFVRSKSFSSRVVNDWNSLTSGVVEAQTTNDFKIKIDKFWQDEIFITPF